MTAEELAAALADLTRRLEMLETGSAPPTPSAGTLDVVTKMLDGLLEGGARAGTVLYAGALQSADGPIAFQMKRGWDELIHATPSSVASSLAALASPVRVSIVQLLLQGPATKAELSAALAEPTAGQLYHHLRELLSAGLVHQPRRAVYAVAPHRRVPLLMLLSAGLDLARPPAVMGSHDDEQPVV